MQVVSFIEFPNGTSSALVSALPQVHHVAEQLGEREAIGEGHAHQACEREREHTG